MKAIIEEMQLIEEKMNKLIEENKRLQGELDGLCDVIFNTSDYDISDTGDNEDTVLENDYDISDNFIKEEKCSIREILEENIIDLDNNKHIEALEREYTESFLEDIKKIKQIINKH